LFSVGEIWLDTKYYYDGVSYFPKYVIVLAVDPSGDAIVVRLTTKSNGLPENPACHHGVPRCGYFVGVPGAAPLHRKTWVAFDDFFDLEARFIHASIQNARYVLTGTTLHPGVYCGLLRCAIQSDDISKKQRNWVYTTIAACGC
jgi:hypothetical protein